jgi:hypothetical protein
MTIPQVAQAKRQLVQNFPKTRRNRFLKNVIYISKLLCERVLCLEFNLWHQPCVWSGVPLVGHRELIQRKLTN